MSALSVVTDRERDLAERLAEAERHCEQLAALLEKMRSKVYSATMCHPNGVQYLLEEALAVPTENVCDDILRKRDARTLREAAQVCEHEADNAVQKVA